MFAGGGAADAPAASGGALGRGARAEWLDWDAYCQDLQSRREGLRGAQCWKLVRRQHFAAGSPLREAVWRRDWEAAAELIEQQRLSVRRSVEADRRRGGRFRCVRVVDEPLSVCLQWELRSLRAQAECGAAVRVVPSSVLGGLECHARLPEVVVLGERTLYEIVRDDRGVAVGAYRRRDAAAAGNWAEFLGQFYALGEDVRAFADRRVPDLPRRPE